MSITKTLFGTLPDGGAVYSFLLSRGPVEVEILNYGAVVRRVLAPDKNGVKKDIVLGFDNLQDYTVNVPSFGAAVGRIVGPVPDLALRVGAGTVMLPPSNDEGGHCHGGRKGFTRALWEAETASTETKDTLRLRYTSPDGEDGYPGTIKAEICYTLDESATLSVAYSGESDRPTPFNPTNHGYFNLAGHDSGSIHNHVVKLLHTRVMANGTPADAGDTPFDLRVARRLGDALDSGDPLMAGGYDNFHELAGEGMRTVLWASEPEGGRTLEIATDANGAIFYSGNYLFDYPGKNGAVYGKSAGFACEPCQIEAKEPFNPSHVPLMDTGKPFYSTTSYTFGVQV